MHTRKKMKLREMKHILFLGTLFFYGFAQAQYVGPSMKKSDSLLERMQEFHERGGLPNIFHAIATRRQVHIGYLGGSITEANDGWRELTFDWLRLKFPETAFYQINSTIGGTASDLGVFRMGQDVLQDDPDLLFVEFAVNDHDEQLSKARIIRSVEGIVRKTWASFPNADICFIYTTSESICKSLISGVPNYAIEAMEEVASYYGIPSVNLSLRIARLYTAGKLLLSGDPVDNNHIIVFTKDHTHPLPESGHPLYGSVVVRYLKEMAMGPKNGKAHLPGRPLDKDNWQAAKMVNIGSTRLEGDWKKLPADDGLSRDFGKFMPEIYKGSPGTIMRFRYKGTVLGFFDCIGPGTGSLDVFIDGREQKVDRFDTYCTYYRKNYFILDSIPFGIHDVEIRVAKDSLDKSLILGRHVAQMGNPGNYVAMDWYPSQLMILGNLIRDAPPK